MERPRCGGVANAPRWAAEAHTFGLPCGGTLELLLEADLDLDPDPVGLHIGSQTPSAIAISAMAGILAVKNEKDIYA